MPCGCEVAQINSCPPYASARDVQRALDAIGACCKGTVPNTTDPEQQPVEALEQGFPNGLGECNCEILWLQNVSGDKLWLSFNNGESWLAMFDPTHCSGNIDITTNPLADPAGATAEAWPDGTPINCEALWLVRGDGGLFVSVDQGANYTSVFTVEGAPVGLHITFASNQYGGASIFIPLVWDAEVLDSDNAWDPGSPTIITAPVTGIYVFSVNILYALNSGSAIWRSAQVMVNSVKHIGIKLRSVEADTGEMSLASVVRLNQGDEMTVEYACSAAFGGEATNGNFYMELIRRI